MSTVREMIEARSDALADDCDHWELGGPCRECRVEILTAIAREAARQAVKDSVHTYYWGNMALVDIEKVVVAAVIGKGK